MLRLGVRGTMLVGLLAWAVVMSVLTAGRPMWLVISSLSLNGVCISCYLVAGQVFVNSRARGDSRASVQAMLSFISAVGLLGGNLLVGVVRRLVDGRFTATFAVAASIAALLVAVFAAGFPEDDS
jgi:predicted MFS family arabinose efflux permease